MRTFILPGIFLLFALFILTAGCNSEPPVKQPVVTVTDIALSDVSLRALTVNTTVNIFNPNPVGAELRRTAFDLYYGSGEAGHYLGHGELAGLLVKENGNTTVTIPVKIGTPEAVNAMGTLVRDGAITVKVNGTATIDLKLMTYDLPFEQKRVFRAEEFTSLVPEISVAGISVNTSAVINQGREILGTFLE
jgi:LEA14-like dessication related protein